MLPDVCSGANPLKESSMGSSARDVRNRVQQRLSSCPYSQVRRTTFTVQNGVVVLEGEVSAFYFKQIAQNVVCGVEGVQRVDNTIDVHPYATSGATMLQ